MVSESLETRGSESRRPADDRFDWARPGQFEAEVVEAEPQRATVIPFPTARFRRARLDEYHAMMMLTAEALEDEW